MKVIITGATGLVGAEVIRQAIQDDAIEKITAITRKPPYSQHPKLATVIHPDFMDYTSLAAVFREHDACIWCLGISQTQVSKETYHTITYSYTMEAARAMVAANPSIGFVFVSGDGADPTERSRTLFARVKGKTEKELSALPFKKLFIARPGGIQPVNINPNTAFLNKLIIPLFPIIKLFSPNAIITSVELSRALIYLAKNGAEKQVLENMDLKKIFREHCNY